MVSTQFEVSKSFVFVRISRFDCGRQIVQYTLYITALTDHSGGATMDWHVCDEKHERPDLFMCNELASNKLRVNRCIWIWVACTVTEFGIPSHLCASHIPPLCSASFFSTEKSICFFFNFTNFEYQLRWWRCDRKRKPKSWHQTANKRNKVAMLPNFIVRTM